MQSGLGFSPYAASKFAVVNMSEGLALQLAPHDIGVSVLCPGFVRTRMPDSARNRLRRHGPARAPDPDSPMGALVARLAELSEAGLHPDVIAAQTLDAIRANDLYVFTLPGMRAEGQARFAAIISALDKAEAR